LRPEAAGRPVEIWFTDEARVGQQGALTRVWAKRGSGPRALRDRRFEWAYLFGAICPERSTGAAIIMPEVNVAAMNEHLAEINRRVSVDAIALLVPLQIALLPKRVAKNSRSTYRSLHQRGIMKASSLERPRSQSANG
jgi:hypothetical protein